MKHTHVHTDGLDGVLWVDPEGELRATNSYAQHQIDQFGRSGLRGQELLNFIVRKLDPATMVGTTECEDPTHLPIEDATTESEDPSDGSGNVEPAPDDNWQNYQGEDSRHHNDVSFSNDTMWLN